MADRYDTLRPDHVVASIASMPQRWRDIFHINPDLELDIEDLFVKQGKDGATIAEHCGAAIAQLHLLRDAMRTTTYPTPEPLDEQIGAAVANRGTGPWPASASQALSAISTVTRDISEQLQALNTHDWNKAASCGGESFTVMKLAQGTSRVAADRLSSVEKLVSELTR